MYNKLIFDETEFTVETVEEEGKTLVYRAFENIPYVTKPADEKIQRLSIFVPELYYEGKSIDGYNLKNAPIFMPNTVGGYMPGPQERPGKDFMGRTNATFFALLHGYVVVSPGVRGREMQNQEGRYIGTAPAVLCDLKAVVRYLRHNAKRIPGDVNKIISNGTSAGGASSSLLGATGNHPDYEEILRSMGAAEERDDIFAASCYCPITNLDHADMAYEWEFYGINDYHGMRIDPPAPGEDKPRMKPIDGLMNEEQQKWSETLAKEFPDYLNSLHLKDENGAPLSLKPDGSGSFREYIASYVIHSAQRELNCNPELRNKTDFSGLSPKAEPEKQVWLTIENETVTGMDWEKYIAFRTRMKQTPAFDNVSLGTPENELFGNEITKYRHFTEFGYMHSKCEPEMADEMQIKMMNPMNYIRDEKAKKALYYRIRHGVIDRDTSLAISAMLTAVLREQGVKVDFAYPWGIPHAGDYDLDELFAWIDSICKK